MALTDIGDDRELALRASHGDQLAFEDLYRRYFQRVYDFALRTVHDADLASSTVRATFVTAWDALRRGSRPIHFRAWLYARAHDAAIDAIRHRTSAAYVNEPLGEDVDLAQVDPSRLVDPQAVAQDQELVDLVWAAARSISPKEYMLLDMHLRQGLAPDELADALATRRGSLDLTLARLKEGLEEAVTYTLLVRRGRGDCPSLEELLEGTDAHQVDATGRRLIARHLEECVTCSERKRHYPSPVEVFSGLAVVPMSLRARSSIWESISDHMQRAALTTEPVAIGWQPSSSRLPLLAGIGTAVLIALIGALFIRSGRSAVRDPANVHSTSHQIGQPSAARVIAVSWQQDPEAQAYGIRWSQQPNDVPDAHEDLAGVSTGTTSPPLEDGSWYFHLRTEGKNGQWTSTVHLGPFVVKAAESSPTPSAEPASAAAAAASTPTSTPPPTATPVPPTPTPRVTPKPSPKATSKPSSTATPKPSTSASASAKPAPASVPASAAPAAATATRQACSSPLSAASMSATTGAGNRVAINWNASGGCAPYKGTITARYQQETNPYTSYPITQLTGSLTDTPPARCKGSYNVVYSLSLADAAGQTTAASALASVIWTC